MNYASNFMLRANGDNLDFLARLISACEAVPLAAYSITDDGLVFYWRIPPDNKNYRRWVMNDALGVAHFIRQWLESLDAEAYGPRPDHDGSTRKGWDIHIGSLSISPWARMVVRPTYIEYYK